MSLEIRQSFSSPESDGHPLDAQAARYMQKKIGGNALLRATAHIDTAVELLHTSFPLDAKNDTFVEDSLRLRAQLDQTSSHLQEQPKQTSDITDYFRLASVHDFAIESAAAQAAFSSTAETEIRDSIIDGLAGTSVARIEQALDIYDSVINPFKKRVLRGVVSEQMALTLTNITENPDRIALPATLRGDLLEKTDIMIYYIADQSGYVVPAQVKSGNGTDAPENGININETMIGSYNDQFSGLNPRQNFQLARILVKLMNGSELDDAETHTLEVSKDHFTRELDKKLANYPGFEL